MKALIFFWVYVLICFTPSIYLLFGGEFKSYREKNYPTLDDEQWERVNKPSEIPEGKGLGDLICDAIPLFIAPVGCIK